jgi:hypothetical protein
MSCVARFHILPNSRPAWGPRWSWPPRQLPTTRSRTHRVAPAKRGHRRSWTRPGPLGRGPLRNARASATRRSPRDGQLRVPPGGSRQAPERVGADGGLSRKSILMGLGFPSAKLWCGEGWPVSGRMQIRVSAYAIAVEDDRLLKTRLSDASPIFTPGLWHLRGGGIDPGEQPS